MRWDWRDVTCWLQSYVGHQARLSSCVLLFCLVQRERESWWDPPWVITLGLWRHWRQTRERQVVLNSLWMMRAGPEFNAATVQWIGQLPRLDLMCAGALYLASSPLWLSRSQSGVTALSLRSLDIPPSLPVSSHTMCGGFCLRPDLSQVLAALDFTLIWNVIGIRLTYFLCQGLNFQLDF